MPERSVEILVVENDIDLAEMIERHLRDALTCRVTHAATAAEAVREELTARHDLVIASMSLPDADGLTLVRELRVSNECPIVLTADKPTIEEAVEAMRLGVIDLLKKPFDMVDLSTSVSKAAKREARRRRERVRHRRLRRLVSRIICERKDLNERLELICKDFVHAYRQLAQKVTDSGALTRIDLD